MEASLLRTIPDQFPIVDLQRDLVREIKRGHRWIFSDCFAAGKKGERSWLAQLNYKNIPIALGLYDPTSALRFRVFCTLNQKFQKKAAANILISALAENWKKAVDLRAGFPRSHTNCFRLINGEGDGLPGLIIDIYNDTAVIKHDQDENEKIWDHARLSLKLRNRFPQLTCIYLKRKNNADKKGQALWGELKTEVEFIENDVKFSSNIRDAAKTGFFLDQRDNRLKISELAKNKTVLNLFCYTGGFSLLALKGGARAVTSVDISAPAIDALKLNYQLNNFSVSENPSICADAFTYVSAQISARAQFDLVICDPPSFAPNEKSITNASEAYKKIFSEAIKLVATNGFFAASSCSGHISYEEFLGITKEAFSLAKKRATVVYLGGQPSDHPYPLAMESQLRYLKFALLRLD